jgi:large subunit ribosomal protein L25
MFNLLAKIRQSLGKKTNDLREQGLLPAVLYGHNKKTQSVEIDYKEFERLYKQAGESSLVSIEIEGKKIPVMIYEVQKDPISGKFLHADFYQVNLAEKIEATIPLVFEGESPAVKDLGGTLVKILHEIDVKAKPEDLPKEIKVDISILKTFEDSLEVKHLKVPVGVEILRSPEDIVAEAKPVEKSEEELAKPVEENVEGVEKVEKEKKEEESETEE